MSAGLYPAQAEGVEPQQLALPAVESVRLPEDFALTAAVLPQPVPDLVVALVQQLQV